MHRQSLGSPHSKLQHHGGALVVSSKDDAAPSLSPSQLAISSSGLNDLSDEDNHKSSKLRPRRFSLSPPSSPTPKLEKLVHIIPFLTLFCFLVLFLVSHTPSQSELAQFDGFRRSSANQADSSEIDRAISSADHRRGEVLPIRSLRSLSGNNGDDGASREYRSHRKFADFQAKSENKQGGVDDLVTS